MEETLSPEKKVKIVYTNHRGETDLREIIPLEMVYTSTEYHPSKQWLLRAFALDRQEERYFSFQNIKAWFV